MRRALIIIIPLLALAAGMLYTLLDAPTATFFLVAGIVLSACAASTTLLGAYTRNKAIARQRALDQAERSDPPANTR